MLGDSSLLSQRSTLSVILSVKKDLLTVAQCQCRRSLVALGMTLRRVYIIFYFNWFFLKNGHTGHQSPQYAHH